jgi:hypothetical protein
MSDFKLVKLLNSPVQLSVNLNPRGVYNPLTAYNTGDSVSYLGSSYVCITATTGNAPTNTTYWQVLAQQGIPGEGVPTGGTAGQFLKKNSSTDYDDSWSTIPDASVTTEGFISDTQYAQLSYEIARDIAVNAYAKELIYTAGILTRINVWTSPAKTVKMYQKDFNYTLGVLSSIATTRVSDSATFTKTLTYTTGVLTEIDGA